jgi:hypothetical protein
MAHVRVANGGDGLQVWRVAAISSGQPTRGGPIAWDLGERLVTPHRKNSILLRNVIQGLDLDGFFGTTLESEDIYEIWNMEFRSLYRASPNILRVTKSRGFCWARRAEHTEEMRNAYKFWSENLKGRDRLEDLGVDGDDIKTGIKVRRLGIFLLTAASRTALGPTQPPMQWVPGTLSLGVKLLGREADHSPPYSAEVKE